MRKYKSIFIVLFCMVSLTSFAQEQPKTEQEMLKKHFRMKYVFGMKYNDVAVAKNAMYDLIALEPMNDSLKLNLAYLYFDNSQFASALFIASDIISRNPNNVTALYMQAASYDNLGVKDKAISAYESLYFKDNNNVEHLYRVMVLQYQIGRFNEAKNNSDIIIKAPESEEIKMQFAKNENENQEISMRAAAYNIKGMIEKEQGNKIEAEKNFNMALELQPEFALAKQNLEDLKNEE
ncbi:MAG TPA: hypothetical protein DDY13_13375 [Cytophagales bacterium]|jgi:tetratricopeptide (TPR) repeat protein|nr:hypothetical protein [Cytophagales bacterium]